MDLDRFSFWSDRMLEVIELRAGIGEGDDSTP